MLTSESVNPTLLPGIIKAIEKYIIVNNTDEVLNFINSTLSNIVRAGVTGAVTGGVAAAVAYAMKNDNVVTRMKKVGKKIKLEQFTGSKVQSTTKQQIVQGAADSIDKASKQASIKKFEMPRIDTVSLEPTYVQVETNVGAKLIGVKVVPFKVKSTTGMVGLLMSDRELKKMDYLSTKASRTIIRVIHRVLKKLPGLKGKSVSGDVKQDVLWASSQFGKNAFVCFSQLDLEQDDIFTSPQAVQKLQKLGWASIIMTDDVNKQVTFCMKEFNGVCSTIPYTFIFSSLGKEHNQAYKDLEDAARSTGPFFRKKSTTIRKIFQNKD